MTDPRRMPILPIEAYTSQEWFDREMENIFSTTWQFAGFIEDVEAAGSYTTVQAGNNNILVVRGQDQRLRAFHNICRHRGTQLLRATGKAQKALTCPYHDWTYSLEGQLVSVPDKEREFPNLMLQDFCLHRASVETWKGMLFVHPEPEAPPLLDWFGGATERIGPHQPTKLREYTEGRATHLIGANWKIVAENYIDAYHLSHLHSETLYMYDHSRIEAEFVGPHFVFYEPLTEEYAKNLESSSPLPLIDHVPAEHRGAFVPLLFPNLGIGATEGSWSTFSILPLAPDRTEVEIRTRVMPLSATRFAAQSVRSALSFPWKSGRKYSDGNAPDPMASGDFMAEDVFACEQQQKALRSSRFAVGASAISGEAPVRGFQSIVANFLGEPGGEPNV